MCNYNILYYSNRKNYFIYVKIFIIIFYISCSVFYVIYKLDLITIQNLNIIWMIGYFSCSIIFLILINSSNENLILCIFFILFFLSVCFFKRLKIKDFYKYDLLYEGYILILILTITNKKI